MNAPQRHGGPDWEPPWMAALRRLDEHIPEQVQLFIRMRRHQLWSMFLVIATSSFCTAELVELLKWLAR